MWARANAESNVIYVRQGLDAPTIFRGLAQELARAHMDRGGIACERSITFNIRSSTSSVGLPSRMASLRKSVKPYVGGGLLGLVQYGGAALNDPFHIVLCGDRPHVFHHA